jgi:hypothetical protein
VDGHEITDFSAEMKDAYIAGISSDKKVRRKYRNRLQSLGNPRSPLFVSNEGQRETLFVEYKRGQTDREKNTGENTIDHVETFPDAQETEPSMPIEEIAHIEKEISASAPVEEISDPVQSLSGENQEGLPQGDGEMIAMRVKESIASMSPTEQECVVRVLAQKIPLFSVANHEKASHDAIAHACSAYLSGLGFGQKSVTLFEEIFVERAIKTKEDGVLATLREKRDKLGERVQRAQKNATSQDIDRMEQIHATQGANTLQKEYEKVADATFEAERIASNRTDGAFKKALQEFDDRLGGIDEMKNATQAQNMRSVFTRTLTDYRHKEASATDEMQKESMTILTDYMLRKTNDMERVKKMLNDALAKNEEHITEKFSDFSHMDLDAPQKETMQKAFVEGMRESLAILTRNAEENSIYNSTKATNTVSDKVWEDLEKTLDDGFKREKIQAVLQPSSYTGSLYEVDTSVVQQQVIALPEKVHAFDILSIQNAGQNAHVSSMRKDIGRVLETYDEEQRPLKPFSSIHAGMYEVQGFPSPDQADNVAVSRVARALKSAEDTDIGKRTREQSALLRAARLWLREVADTKTNKVEPQFKEAIRMIL